MVRIAIDAMGGDNAPKEIVQGVVPCSKGNANCRVSIIRRRSKSECMLGGITSKYSRDFTVQKKINSDDEPV